MKNRSEPVQQVDGSFLRALQEHKQGAVLTELSEKMRAVVEAAQLSGKTAKLTLEVCISPNGNAVAFTAEVKTKLPSEKPYAGVFFVDDSNNLFRNDPKQQEITLKTVVSVPQPAELQKAVNQ